MDTLKLWMVQAKWVLLALVAVGIAVLTLALRGLFDANSNHPKASEGGFLPKVSETLQQAVDGAAATALAQKAATKAVTEEKRQQLSNLSAIQDAKARRKALADFYNTL